MYRLDIRLAGNAPVRVVQERGAWSATASPDGSMIAFACASDGPAICVANRDGSGVRLLTPGAANEDHPAWSPDGTRIAFRRWPAGGPPGPFNRADIWVMNADGSNQVNLTADDPSRVWHASPTWSPRQPDGSYRIAYARFAQPASYVIGRIHSMRADGSDKRLVTSGGEYTEDEPAWSPDGSTIVFVRTGGTAAGDLWLVDAAGGRERPLMASDPADDQRSPKWSPDGRFIAFASKHELTWGTRWVYQLYTVRADGSDLTRRSNEGKDVEHPAWLVR
jgi:Tol biopolymer transport system component